MRLIIPIVLSLVGALHLLPAIGAWGAVELKHLYGVSIADPNLLLLMRHRAVLFALLGGFLVAAAWRPALHGMALLAGTVSVTTFLVMARAPAGYTAEVQRVIWLDWAALVMLLVAAAIWWWKPSASPIS